MSLSNLDFHDYALSLNPVLFRSFLGGDLNAYDVYNRVTTTGANSEWHRRKVGHGIQHYSSPTTVADGVEQHCTAVTLFVKGTCITENRNAIQQQRLMSKRTAAGEMWRFYCSRNGANRYLVLGAGGAFPLLIHDYRGARSFAVTFQSSAVPSFYLDGVFIGLGSVACGVITPSPRTINIGAAYNNVEPYGAPIHVAIQFPSILTDEQISDLHRLYLEDARGVPTAPARTISLPKRDMNNALLYLSGSKDAAGNVVDLSGNALDAAVTGRVGEQREHVSGARVQHFHGAGGGVVTVPASGLLTGHAGQTYSGLVRVDGDGEAGGGRIFSTDIGGAVRAELFTRNVNDLRFSRLFADGQADWDVAIRPGNVLPCHLIVRHDGDPTHLPTGLVNGRAMPFAVSTGRTGALTSDVGADTKLGNRDALDRTLAGTTGSAKFHGEVLTDEQARVEYLQHAVRGIELAPRRAYPVTLANVASGRCGPWDRISGTWSYQDDGTRRQLVNVAAGTCAASSDQAYGAWYWRTTKSLNSNSYFMFVASRRAVVTDGAQNGYLICYLSDERIRLYRFDNGAGPILISIAAGYINPLVEYEWFITRAYDGFFSWWIRGGVYTTWTVVGTATDNTYTTSAFCIAQVLSDTEDEFSDVITYPLGDTLDPRTEVPGLED